LEDSPEYIDASASKGDDGLMVSFSLASLAVIEGAAVVVAERAEGGLVEDALEGFVATGGPTEEAGLAGLAQDRPLCHRQKPRRRRSGSARGCLPRR